MKVFCTILLLGLLKMFGETIGDVDSKSLQIHSSDVMKGLDTANLTARSGSQYVGEECCNLSTTPTCKKKGGKCVPLNETCYGDVYHGQRHCVISNLKSCKCCVPIDCVEKTLSPCKKLNGTCIGAHEDCDGRSVSGNEFCGKSDNCRCCFPEDSSCPEYPQECFQVENQWFTEVPADGDKSWDDAYNTCTSRGYTLPEPDDIKVLGQHLYDIRGKVNFWMGAKNLQDDENNLAWISTSDVIGNSVPWVNHWSNYTNCLYPDRCMYLLNHPNLDYCTGNGWCVTCNDCDLRLKNNNGTHLCQCTPMKK